MRPALRFFCALLALALVSFAAAPAGAQGCYTIAIAQTHDAASACLSFGVNSDGCSVVTASAFLSCGCPYPPVGSITVYNWALGIGVQQAASTVPGIVGLLAIVPDVVLDLTPTNGNFVAVLPSSPLLSGVTVYLQAAAFHGGTGGCFYPLAWELTDAFQITFV
jgi:hypothetical protein